MRTVFLDTSAWLAALSGRETGHAVCRDGYAGLVQSGAWFVTTNLVVAELHALVGRERGSRVALGLLDALHEDGRHEVVYVTRDVERAAADRWLRPFADAAFSLTDATSFEVMRERRIRDAFTLDHHFARAGFQMVPRSAVRSTVRSTVRSRSR